MLSTIFIHGVSPGFQWHHFRLYGKIITISHGVNATVCSMAVTEPENQEKEVKKIINICM